MKRLVFLNKFDVACLHIITHLAVTNDELHIVLAQGAAYFAVENGLSHEPVKTLIEKGTRLYVLATDVDRRGIRQKLFSEVELLDYSALVELLFREDQAVINL
jgi:sulfur relay protein TusB/DsrH